MPRSKRWELPLREHSPLSLRHGRELESKALVNEGWISEPNCGNCPIFDPVSGIQRDLTP
jgi:hypothetical protein